MLDKSFVGKWVSFDQIDCNGNCEGHVDKALVVSKSQVYLNTKDNPKCRPGTGHFVNLKCPKGMDYGWAMCSSCPDRIYYKNLRLLDEIGEL